MFDLDVAVLDPPERPKSLLKCSNASQHFGIVLGERMQERHATCALALLRARRERPRRRAGKCDNELSPSNMDCHVTLPWGSYATGNITTVRVCGKSAYAPKLTGKADVLQWQLGAKRRPEQVQRKGTRRKRRENRPAMAMQAVPARVYPRAACTALRARRPSTAACC